MRARTLGGDADDFFINIGLHQGLALSLFLFSMVLDGLTEEIQDEVSWYMLFFDNIVPIMRSGMEQITR